MLKLTFVIYFQTLVLSQAMNPLKVFIHFYNILETVFK